MHDIWSKLISRSFRVHPFIPNERLRCIPISIRIIKPEHEAVPAHQKDASAESTDKNLNILGKVVVKPLNVAEWDLKQNKMNHWSVVITVHLTLAT